MFRFASPVFCSLIAMLLSLPAWGRADDLSMMLHYDRPAVFFEEALVIGNGTMGGVVYGGTQTDKISLNDITLWTGEPCNMNCNKENEYG